MPRLRNDLTGAVMTVDDSIAEQLGSEWVEEKTTTRRKSSASTDSKTSE